MDGMSYLIPFKNRWKASQFSQLKAWHTLPAVPIRILSCLAWQTQLYVLRNQKKNLLLCVFVYTNNMYLYPLYLIEYLVYIRLMFELSFIYRCQCLSKFVAKVDSESSSRRAHTCIPRICGISFHWKNMLWSMFKHATCGVAYYHIASCSKARVCRWCKIDFSKQGKTSQIRDRNELFDNFIFETDDMICHRLRIEFNQDLIHWCNENYMFFLKMYGISLHQFTGILSI